MHEAYRVHPMLKDAEGMQIESIAAYGDNVIVGTRSGQLIMYTVVKDCRLDMQMYNKSFSKKPITQMEVVGAEHLLFVLTDGMIHVCDISRLDGNFCFIHSSAATKGCSLFTLDVKTTQSEMGVNITVIQICCAIKRRLEMFYWKQDTLQLLQCSVDLKDVPKAMSWANDIICVGFKEEYVLYNIAKPKPEAHNLILTSSPCICLMKNNTILGVSKEHDLILIDPIKYIKRNDQALSGTLELEEEKAKLTPLQWSGPLLNLVWDEPYVIGRVGTGIEVRSLERCGINRDTLVQSIPNSSEMKLLVRSGVGTIFAAANSRLWYIRGVDVPTQRQQLLQQKRFQWAIDITPISDEPEVIKAETIRGLRMAYGRVLFLSKQFSAAMQEFKKAPADPNDVISLFPNLMPDQPKTTTDNSGNAVVPAAPVLLLEDKDLENAILALIDFLRATRPKEAAKVLDRKSNSTELLSIIDTTLLKCYLLTNDSLVAPLLRLNQCHFGETEKILKKHNKLAELTILYEKKGKHRKALELLRDQATGANGNCERIICYLQCLDKRHIKEVFEFASWVLERQPVDGLRIFTDDGHLEASESLPRAEVLDFLISKHKALVIPYLEHIINVWNDATTLNHNVLINLYRQKVQHLMNELQSDTADSAQKDTMQAALQQDRNKLYNFLKESTHYSPDVVLKDFPTNVLLEERALILGRLSMHKQVLTIYIQVLGDVQAACEYCETHYANDRDIFLTLLQTILHPLKQPPYEGVQLHADFLVPNQEIVFNIVNNYAAKIDPCKLFPNLPDDMPVYRLSKYLDTVVRTEMAEKHHLQILKGLLSSEIIRTKALIREHTKKFVELNDSSVCAECRKRFTNPMTFVRYPTGEVVHLSCHDRKTQTASSS